MDEFVKQHLKYPQEAFDHKVEGTVSVDFDIDVFGDVVETRIKHGLGYGCDEEAERIVKLLKFEKKRYQGMRVVFHRNINIHFRLTSNPVPGQQLNYQYKEKPSTGTTFGYTINTGGNQSN